MMLLLVLLSGGTARKKADLAEAERSFCHSIASGFCTVVCIRFLRGIVKRATCVSLCTSIAEKACAYIIHGDLPPCPVTVVIDENGVHHMVTVPCPMSGVGL